MIIKTDRHVWEVVETIEDSFSFIKRYRVRKVFLRGDCRTAGISTFYLDIINCFTDKVFIGDFRNNGKYNYINFENLISIATEN